MTSNAKLPSLKDKLAAMEAPVAPVEEGKVEEAKPKVKNKKTITTNE